MRLALSPNGFSVCRPVLTLALNVFPCFTSVTPESHIYGSGPYFLHISPCQCRLIGTTRKPSLFQVPFFVSEVESNFKGSTENADNST